jgi:hypothetical protein
MTFGTFEVNKSITVPFKSIGIDYRQILALKVSAMPQSILRSKTIADTMTDAEKNQFFFVSMTVEWRIRPFADVTDRK